MTERRCMAKGCGHFHDKKLTACPKCGTPRYGYSEHLRIAQMNNSLYAEAARNA